MHRLAFLAALCSAAVISAGCASPAAHFYTLSATASGAPASSPSGLAVMVGPVSIPAHLDQPQIVVSTGPNQVSFDELNRWAAPLGADISRVIALDLIEILGTPRVWLSQQSLSAHADYRVAIDVQGFESGPDQSATLNAAWTVRRTRDGKTQSGRTALREPATGTGFDALAGAHSRTLARLSQDVADAIRVLQAGIP